MELIKVKAPTRCEIGACKNRASHTLKLSRAGIRSAINICPDCLKALGGVIASSIVPKSFETAKPKVRSVGLE